MSLSAPETNDRFYFLHIPGISITILVQMSLFALKNSLTTTIPHKTYLFFVSLRDKFLKYTLFVTNI